LGTVDGSIHENLRLNPITLPHAFAIKLPLKNIFPRGFVPSISAVQHKIFSIFPPSPKRFSSASTSLINVIGRALKWLFKYYSDFEKA
jgi:hypothetical protein